MLVSLLAGLAAILAGFCVGDVEDVVELLLSKNLGFVSVLLGQNQFDQLAHTITQSKSQVLLHKTVVKLQTEPQVNVYYLMDLLEVFHIVLRVCFLVKANVAQVIFSR